MQQFLKQWWQANGGNFSVITALILLPLMAAIGCSVDISNALRQRETLRQAANAAMLDALSEPALRDLYSGETITDLQLKALAARAERNFFAMVPDEVERETGVRADVAVTLKDARITATIRFSGEMRTDFMSMVGVKTVPIDDMIQSYANLSRFTDVHILVDNSPSMTLAANDAERLKLVALIRGYEKGMKRGFEQTDCAFACHDTNMRSDQAKNYFAIARMAGIKLRFDTLQNALLDMLDAAGERSDLTRQFLFNLYDLGDSMATWRSYSAVNRLRDESDIETVKMAVRMQQPMSTPFEDYNSKAGSSLESALEEVQTNIPRAGNGSTSASRLQLLIFLTDGVSNSLRTATCKGGQRWAPLGQCIGPLQTKVCDQMKQRGIRIAIIDTTYLPIPTSPYFMRRVDPFLAQVRPNLEACASPGLFRTVDYGQSVDEALKSLFRQSLHYVQLVK